MENPTTGRAAKKVDKISSTSTCNVLEIRKICPSAFLTFIHFFSLSLAAARKPNLEMIHNYVEKLSSEKTPQQYASAAAAEQHLPFFHHTLAHTASHSPLTVTIDSSQLTAFKREIGRTKK